MDSLKNRRLFVGLIFWIALVWAGFSFVSLGIPNMFAMQSLLTMSIFAIIYALLKGFPILRDSDKGFSKPDIGAFLKGCLSPMVIFILIIFIAIFMFLSPKFAVCFLCGCIFTAIFKAGMAAFGSKTEGATPASFGAVGLLSLFLSGLYLIYQDPKSLLCFAFGLCFVSAYSSLKNRLADIIGAQFDLIELYFVAVVTAIIFGSGLNLATAMLPVFIVTGSIFAAFLLVCLLKIAKKTNDLFKPMVPLHVVITLIFTYLICTKTLEGPLAKEALLYILGGIILGIALVLLKKFKKTLVLSFILITALLLILLGGEQGAFVACYKFSLMLISMLSALTSILFVDFLASASLETCRCEALSNVFSPISKILGALLLFLIYIQMINIKPIFGLNVYTYITLLSGIFLPFLLNLFLTDGKIAQKINLPILIAIVLPLIVAKFAGIQILSLLLLTSTITSIGINSTNDQSGNLISLNKLMILVSIVCVALFLW